MLQRHKPVQSGCKPTWESNISRAASYCPCAGRKRSTDTEPVTGHMTRPCARRCRGVTEAYLLYEVQSPVPVVMTGQDVSALEPHKDLSITPARQQIVGERRPVPASPSLSSGGNSGPCPPPPSSRTRGPPRGRPRRRPESERGPARQQQMRTSGGRRQENSKGRASNLTTIAAFSAWS